MNINSPLDQFADLLDSEVSVWSELHGSADALAIAQYVEKQNRPVAVLVGNIKEADTLTEALKFYAGDGRGFPIHQFPGWECLPYDTFSPHPDILSQRIHLLSVLPTLAAGVLIVSADTLMQRLPPTDFIEQNSFSFATGGFLDVESLQQKMSRISYRKVQQVEDPGEYVVRGGVIDVFTMGADAPIRIELFGDQIETIRYFDPDTQLSTQKVVDFQILPGSEICLTEDAIRLFRQGIRENINGDPRRNVIYSSIDSDEIPNGAEFYLPLFFHHTSSLLDYMSSHTQIFQSGTFDSGMKRFWNQVNERFVKACEFTERLPLPPEMVYFSPTNLESRLKAYDRIRFYSSTQDQSVRFSSVEPIEISMRNRSTKNRSQLKECFAPAPNRNLICVGSAGQKQLIENWFRELNIPIFQVDSWRDFLNGSAKNAYCDSNLPVGLHLPNAHLRVLASAELFGQSVKARKKIPKSRNPESLISSMEDLQIDDPVVHEQYGVGLYKGLVTMNVSGADEEYLSIRYRDKQTLYVPVYAIDHLSRYIGAQSEDLVLDALSSKKWHQSKRNAQMQAFDVAAELLDVQVQREQRAGNSMPIPEADYQLLAARFPYSETPDQEKAIAAVLKDLAADRPMDRLVCGDVGFGKTEVALRGALVATANGYQVAVIVPTTLLAQQHFDVFQDRFVEFGIEVKLLSRMVKSSEGKNIVKDLKGGKIDVIIGTHRLLQSDVEFSNLGLVIIDEEHRFGVRHKEHLKKLRTEVDFLTMTATPIPRTLSMVMNELRDISIIATPPDNRLSIRTFVRNWDAGTIREACLRELGRGGQIFFVHNEIQSIQRIAREITQIVPEARIAVAHGQMPKLDLERVMRDYYLQKFDLLVCTTIIESGIDIPTANTIIINRASKFGLAQLHQLRGRVGRSHHQAYAYLLVASREFLSSDARRRLEAIEAFDELGMGYVLATHDLEIRGAGDLLGKEQSGTINRIGYSLYAEILKTAVKELKEPSGKATDSSFDFNRRVRSEINLQVSALLPDSWIPNVNLRLKLYRRIASADNRFSLNRMKTELIDRFGKLPEEVEHLFSVHHLKHWCEQLGISKLTIGPKHGKIIFGANPEISMQGLKSLIDEYDGAAKLSQADYSMHFQHSLPTKAGRITVAYQILEQLSPKSSDITEKAAAA